MPTGAGSTGRPSARRSRRCATSLARCGYGPSSGRYTLFTPPRRPHNCLYVISADGDLVTRYDERMLSNTKLSFMYTPGAEPVTFEAGGVSFGCTLGMEAHYPELFLAYERLGVECVLFSTTGGTSFAAEMPGHAASNSFWTSFAVHVEESAVATAGIVAPTGNWVSRCQPDTPSIAVTDIVTYPADPARPWRQTARSGIYDARRAPDDPRSLDRTAI